MHKQFKLSQQAVIFNQKGEFLILYCENGNWLLPGGRVDEGEMDLTKALARELQEECNFKLKEIIKPVWFDVTPTMGTYAIAFECIVENQENLKISSEHTEYKWIKPSEAKECLYYKNIANKIAEIYG